MGSLLSGEERGKSSEREVNTGEWNKVSLELVQVNVERSIETEGSSDG